MSDYISIEAVTGDESHMVSVPSYILTDAIEDGLTFHGTQIEVEEFLRNCIFSTDDFSLTKKGLDSIERFFSTRKKCG